MSSSHNALGFCSAVVVGYQGDSRSLISLATKVGFGAIQELNEAPDVQRPEFPVVFFLVNFRLSDQTKGTLLRRLRRSPANKVRFAPVVAIGQDVAFEVVLDHVELGFDDFISLPEGADVVANRLINQLDQLHTYIETATYFGPDRRRMEAPEVSNNLRSALPHSHARLTIRRSVHDGVQIVNQQVFH